MLVALCSPPQLVEGFTFVDHFRRTYPSIMVYKCQVGMGDTATAWHTLQYISKQPQQEQEEEQQQQA
jgi:hypothetical protein